MDADRTIETAHGIATPGSTLGSYRIERLLGRGGMGAVFLAYDTTLHRSVALKVVDAAGDDETSRSRVLREARNAGALNHPNICTIHEVGHASGATYIAMEHVEGRSLRDRLDEGALPLEEALRYGRQAADALAYAHEHGVVHRDFKAANAMTTGDGRLKIVDFGLARRDDALMAGVTTIATLVPAGAAAGTPYAMAPEQVRGEATDARTDIWALGVLLYEMVTGATPFKAATIPDLFSSILRDAPAPWPASVAVAIKPVVERCLEKDPARRYQRAGDVRAALDTIQSGMVSRLTAWRYHLNRRRWLAPAAALLCLGAVVVGFNAGGVRDRLVGNALAPAPIKLAVLPFENLTGDPDQEFFSDGLTDEMITQLGRLHPARLSVIARTSSMRYKNRDTPLDQIGRELGVDYVLEGSARREGSRVRINATLIHVRDQTQRWAESYDRELAGIFALQNDVARGVSGSLALSLLPAEQARLDAVRPVNPEAYEAVLRGRSHVIKLTREDLDTAMQYFELALQKDPGYGLAYAGMVGVWSGRRQLGFAPSSEATPRMKAAAAKAIEYVGEDSAFAYLRLALDATFTEWNWVEAEPAFRRAIELAPSDAEARAFYGHYLEIMHRPADAMMQMRRAMELDPLSELIQSLYGATLMRAGRLDEGILNARNILKTTPNSSQALGQLSSAFHRLGRYEEALSVEKQMMAARGDRVLADALNRGYAEAGYRGAMRHMADAQIARPFGRGRAPGLYVRAGEHERALDALEQNFELRDPGMPYVGVQEIFEPLRKHPRFQALLRKMNLPT